MKRAGVVLALMFQAVLLAASGDDARVARNGGDQKPKPEPTPEQLLKSYDEKRPDLWPLPFTAMRIGTWNTMLQPWLPYQDAVVQTIASTKLDLLVLEEVWTEAARQAILSNPSVKAKYPYSHYVPAQQQPGQCPLTAPEPVPAGPSASSVASGDGKLEVTAATITDYIDCLISTGSDTRTVEQPVQKINVLCQFLGLNITLESQPCTECLNNTMQNLPSGDPGAYGARDHCFAGSGVKFSHQGQPGLLILSRRPLEDVTDVNFDTFSIRRVNSYATISGVRFAFAHLPENYLFDIDPDLGPFQSGALQPDLAEDIISHGPTVVLGDFNSGPVYQPEGYKLLVNNKYRPLFSQPTYCPAATHSTFGPCVEARGGAAPANFQKAVDNIFLLENGGACLKATFAEQPVSDHIGLAALCILRKQ